MEEAESGEPDEETVERALEEAHEEPLLSIEEAVARVPEELRKEMQELLRAEFREVWHWQPPHGKH